MNRTKRQREKDQLLHELTAIEQSAPKGSFTQQVCEAGIKAGQDDRGSLGIIATMQIRLARILDTVVINAARLVDKTPEEIADVLKKEAGL